MHVIATAGHVDHGKSTLVRALTGMTLDRRPEERRRGLTIDLGYAWATLDPVSTADTTVAFVDVPGHRRFVTQMLAGVGPAPATLLVVAADDGWGRQTGEHVAALDALGVTHGVLAATRADLADPETAIEEAHTYLSETGLAGIEAIGVSPVSGVGLGELRDALIRMTARLPPPPLAFTRLWVDRVFTVSGAGTVVTGTLASGTITLGEALAVAGSADTVHVRRIEPLKQPVEAVSAVARVAVNVRTSRRYELKRGDAIVGTGQWTETDVVDVRFSRPLVRPPTQLITHVGSAAVPTVVRLFDDRHARLRLARPLPLHVCDRAILRDPGAQRVLTGALVLDVSPGQLARRGAAAARGRQLTRLTGTPDLADELARRRIAATGALHATGIATVSPGTVGAVTVGTWLIDNKHWAHLTRELSEAVRRWAAGHPLQPGMPRAAVVRALKLPDPAIVEALVASVGNLVGDGTGIHVRDARIVLPQPIREALDALQRRLIAGPFDAPEADELRAAHLTEPHLTIAANDGELIRIAGGIFLRPDALSLARDLLAPLPQPFTPGAARTALSTTRRVAVPLLELMDKRGLTHRLDGGLRTVPPADSDRRGHRAN